MSAQLLKSAHVSPEIWQRYPSYTAQLLIVEGIANQPSNDFSENFLLEVERQAIELLNRNKLDDLPEVQLWRETFLSFGVKPRDGRSSFEALLRRVEKGLPRIDFLTDLYNALSVKHLMPIGGENFDKYQSAPRLEFALGNEEFDTTANGELVVVNPAPGEVVWRDDAGITCRRWNWRQCVRTRLGLDTKTALFIFDGLGENSAAKVLACQQELLELISQPWSDLSYNWITLTNN